MFHGTTAQLINALNHMADHRSLTIAEKNIVSHAAELLQRREIEDDNLRAEIEEAQHQQKMAELERIAMDEHFAKYPHG